MTFKKKQFSPVLILAALLIVLTALFSCAKNAGPASREAGEPAAFSGEYPVFFGGEKTTAVVRLFGTRPYIGNKAVAGSIGKAPVQPSSLKFPRHEYDGDEYISLADAALNYGSKSSSQTRRRYAFGKGKIRSGLPQRRPARLGYTPAFWEFPHYDATEKQADLAAEDFDLIYQCHPDHKNDRVLDRRMYGSRQVTFLPTPADYVYSEYDKDGILGRPKNLSGNDARSLFLHPSIDYRNISVRLEGKTAEPYYDARGILPAIVSQMTAQGYKFRTAGS